MLIERFLISRNVEEENTLYLPIDARFLDAQFFNERIHAWFGYDTHNPQKLQYRKFKLFLDSEDIPYSWKYIKTISNKDAYECYHLCEYRRA